MVVRDDSKVQLEQISTRGEVKTKTKRIFYMLYLLLVTRTKTD